MPADRKRKQRDVPRAVYGARSQALGRVDPADAAEPEPEWGDTRWQFGKESFASVVGSSAHQEKNEDTVLRLVNEVRGKANLRRLRADPKLRAAARAHSRDMARRDFCAHNNPDGVTPAERMLSAGYSAPGAENVARGQETPHIVMDAWMNSPGHRANLLNPAFTAIGIGVVFVGRNGPCWTQNFGY